ncbi:MAG TPA: S8 family serine peptidase [Steroidobacteraceae bacterium]|jgi:subtilisin family serine protease|nr:S8 family serine peptidase [Steroidobacteraceae bacterium]
MRVWQRRVAAGFVASVVSVLSLAQVRHAPLPPQRSGPWITVFGADQPSAGAADATGAPLRRLDGALRGIARAGAVAGRLLSADSLHVYNPAIHLRVAAPSVTPEVLVDVVASADPATTQRALESLGMRNSARAANLIGGWLPVTALAQVAQLSAVDQVRASMPRTRATVGPVAVQGDFVQGSKALRTQYPTLTGTGTTVGILSDSFNCYNYYATHGPTKLGNGYNGYATNSFAATLADDVASGALPAGIDVVEEADCADYGAPQQLPFGDEGRAMAQVVYAVAPGAQLAFHTAANSEADFAAGITQLQKLGANIIVDDVGYPDEPFFQDGVIAQAVTTAAAAGVAYFSAAGNDGRNSYETTTPAFVAQGARSLLNFDTSGATTATTLPITLPPVGPGEFVLLVVQWDQPYVTGAPGSPGAANTLNFCIDSANPGADWVAQANGPAQIVTYPVCTGANSLGADPVLILALGNPANATAPTVQETLNLSVQLVSGAAPHRVKFLLSDNGLGATIDSFATLSPTLQGHPNAAGAVAVAAALYFQTPACGSSPAILEPFSSYGDDPILFDTNGVALATPLDRNQPDLTGPDGINDTFLGFQLANSSANSPPWNSSGQFVTAIAQCQNNAEYPNFFGTSAAAPHAAAAAALLWQANPALTAGQITAALEQTALPMAAGAQGSGAGFIQVDAALDVIPVGAPTLSIAPTEIVAGSAATLSWASYATRSCTATGDWNGAQATSGTVQVMPTAAGTLSYSLTCTGANGTGTAATVTLTVQSAAGHHGGGALDGTTLAVLLLLLVITWPAAPWRARTNA